MDEQPKIPAAFTLAQWHIVAAGLGELPYKVSAPLIHDLQQQVVAAQRAQAACAVPADAIAQPA